MTPARAIPLVLLLAVVVRVPFWIEALRTPVDGDTAIVGLMARHPGVGTTMWGQPYGSPVDSWVALPFVAVWGNTTEALRLPVFLLGLGLVPVAYALARQLHPAAALPAAVLMACPPPYFLLLSAMPPPFYATSLLLCGLVLVTAAQAARRLGAPQEREAADPEPGRTRRPSARHAAAAGPLRGARPVDAPDVGERGRGGRGLRLLARAGPRRLLLWALCRSWPRARRSGCGPCATPRRRRSSRSRAATRPPSATSPRSLPRLHEPIAGVLGAHVPVVADSEDFVLHAPGWTAGLLVLVYGFALVLAGRATGGAHPSVLCFVAAGLAVLAFPLPVRASPHTIRFLTPLLLPVLALVAWGASPRGTTRRAWVVALSLSALHLVGGLQLLEAWRGLERAGAPFLLPDLRPVRRLLDESGVRHAYASYGPAFRLTWESGERIVASPPWNDRFRHWPLPLLDEVRFAKNVAWVLTPAIPSGLPQPHELDEALRRIGGRWRRADVAGAVLYLGFVPPFTAEVEPWPAAGAAGDRDLRTYVAPTPGLPFVLQLPGPRTLAGVTLLSAADGPRLPRSFDLEVSADGGSFEVVASRRRREERLDLRWLNGHPQAVIDHDVIAVGLGGRAVRALRITPWKSNEPWRLGELLLHAQPGRNPWDEWLPPGLDWEARRRALVEQPLPRARGLVLARAARRAPPAASVAPQ